MVQSSETKQFISALIENQIEDVSSLIHQVLNVETPMNIETKLKEGLGTTKFSTGGTGD